MFYVNTKKYYDKKKIIIEDRLGEILAEIFSQADDIRIKAAEAERERLRREEEERQRELLKKRREKESEDVTALVYAAEDYELAMKIRVYIAALENCNDIDDAKRRWIEWAKQKADWIDPTIDKDDELLGKYQHPEPQHNNNTPSYNYGYDNYSWWQRRKFYNR